MRRFSLCLSLAAALGLVGPAFAQTAGGTPSGQSEVQGATTGLGESHRFASPSAAAQHCPSDTIVWASGKQLTYVTSGAAGYGQSQPGFYACKQEADDAGFHPAS